MLIFDKIYNSCYYKRLLITCPKTGTSCKPSTCYFLPPPPCLARLMRFWLNITDSLLQKYKWITSQRYQIVNRIHQYNKSVTLWLSGWFYALREANDGRRPSWATGSVDALASTRPRNRAAQPRPARRSRVHFAGHSPAPRGTAAQPLRSCGHTVKPW